MLIPSIDLKSGQVVQLIQGERPAIATNDVDFWVNKFKRFKQVQLIDLDAAMGIGSNNKLVHQITPQLSCRVGGGIRTLNRAKDVLADGAKSVIVGSSLFDKGQPNLDFAATLAEAVGTEQIIAAVDSKGGKVVIKGWKESVNLRAVEAVQALEPYCSEFLYTHVDSEGLMQGTDFDAIFEIRQATSRRLTAAGGITDQNEIELLDREGIDAVVGMAIYTGSLNIEVGT